MTIQNLIHNLNEYDKNKNHQIQEYKNKYSILESKYKQLEKDYNELKDNDSTCNIFNTFESIINSKLTIVNELKKKNKDLQEKINILEHNQNTILNDNKNQYNLITELKKENKELLKMNKSLTNQIQIKDDKYVNILSKGYFIDYELFVALVNTLYINKLNDLAEKLVYLAQEQDNFLKN